jgi:hypothetical protein
MIKKEKRVAKLGVMFSERKKIVLLDSISLLGTIVTSIRIVSVEYHTMYVKHMKRLINMKYFIE